MDHSQENSLWTNTQYHEAWQFQIPAWEQYRCWDFILSNQCSWGLRFP